MFDDDEDGDGGDDCHDDDDDDGDRHDVMVILMWTICMVQKKCYSVSCENVQFV